jgi:hypothetical protein
MENRQQRAAAVGADNVVQIWESMNDGYPYFAVFFNRNSKYFQYNRDDLEAARSFLLANLQAVEDAGDNSLYYLNIYSEAKPNYSNKDMLCSIPFRLNAYTSPNEIGGVGSSAGMDQFLKVLKESQDKQLEMARELAELKAAEPPVDWFDRIGALMQDPNSAQVIGSVVNPIVTILGGILQKLTGALPLQNMQPMANLNPGIAGVDAGQDVTDQIDAALDRLEKHCDLADTLTKLADFADKNPMQFKTYLTFLK